VIILTNFTVLTLGSSSSAGGQSTGHAGQYSSACRRNSGPLSQMPQSWASAGGGQNGPLPRPGNWY